MPRSALILLAAAAVAVLAAAPAQAAFAPALSVQLDPPRPAAQPVVTATFSLEAGQTAPARLTLAFPEGFALERPAGLRACRAGVRGERASVRRLRACPRRSEVGTVQALTQDGRRLAGSISYARVQGGPGVVALLASGSRDRRPQALAGAVRVAASGGPNITLDGFADVPLASVTFRLTGGSRSLVRTPRRCRPYLVQARATSQLGELAIALAEVKLRGCESAKRPHKRHRAR